MKFAVYLLPCAEHDIDSHCEFLAEHDIRIALKFDEAVFESFNRLAEMPNIGVLRTYENVKLAGIRLWFVKGFGEYLIFYRVLGNYIEIIRVLHSAQDVSSILESELLT